MNNKSKFIVIVTDAWYPQVNGVVTTIEKTIEELKNKDFRVLVIEPSMFKTIKCPTYKSIDLSWNAWILGTMLKTTNPDYIHISTEGPLGVAAKLWCDKNNKNYTTSIHTRYPEYIQKYFKFGKGAAYRFMKWFHGKSKNVMVNTESMKQVFEDKGFKNLCLWSRGVDTDLFKPNDTFLDYEKPVLLNVGRVCVEKNLEDFYKLEYSGTKIQVGDGPMLTSYMKKYPSVLFVGEKKGEELAAYFRLADVFVFPSKSDTYGLVMLESMASGVPVAAYPVEGPKDVVIDGVTGILENNLSIAIRFALELDSNKIREWSLTKSWSACTDQFILNLVSI